MKQTLWCLKVEDKLWPMWVNFSRKILRFEMKVHGFTGKEYKLVKAKVVEIRKKK